jgi:hypothetical protein
MRQRQVFSDAEESELEECILAASKMYYVLTTEDVRILACQYAVKHKVTIPAGWCGEADWIGEIGRKVFSGHPGCGCKC